MNLSIRIQFGFGLPIQMVSIQFKSELNWIELNEYLNWMMNTSLFKMGAHIIALIYFGYWIRTLPFAWPY